MPPPPRTHAHTYLCESDSVPVGALLLPPSHPLKYLPFPPFPLPFSIPPARRLFRETKGMPPFSLPPPASPLLHPFLLVDLGIDGLGRRAEPQNSLCVLSHQRATVEVSRCDAAEKRLGKQALTRPGTPGPSKQHHPRQTRVWRDPPAVADTSLTVG